MKNDTIKLNDIIDFLEPIKYNDYFNIQFYYMIQECLHESAFSLFFMYKNNNIINNTNIYISFNGKFLYCDKYTKEEKINIILKTIIDSLTKRIKKSIYKKLKVNENIKYNLDNSYIIKSVFINNYFNMPIHKYEDKISISNISINYLELINVNDLVFLPFFNDVNNLTHFYNMLFYDYNNIINNFKVIEKEKYNRNDYLLFMCLAIVMKENEMEFSDFYFNILDKYLEYILKHYKISIPLIIMNDLSRINVKYIRKILNSLSFNQIFILVNNGYIKDISWIRYIDKNIKIKLLSNCNLSFQDKIKLTNYMKG